MVERRYLLPQEGSFFKANLHCHSRFSDGKYAPADLKILYMQAGYSVIAFSDHSQYRNHADLTDDKFVAIAACEIETSEPDTTEGGFDRVKTYHLNIFDTNPQFMTQEKMNLVQPNNWYCSITEINEYLAKIQKMGFLISYNHPYWSLQNYDDYKDLKNLWAVEIFNFGAEQEGNYGYAPQVYDDLLRLNNEKNLFCIAADDNHNWQNIDGIEGDSFGGFTMIKAKTLKYADIMDALIKGDFYASMGPQITELYLDGNILHIETSPVKKITVSTAGRQCYTKFAAKDKLISQADIRLSGKEGYIRVDCIDDKGLHANTNAYFLQEIQAFQVSSLEKVFADSQLIKKQINKGIALRGERFSWQIALKLAGLDKDTAEASIEIESALSPFCRIYREGMVPAQFTAYENCYDEDYITNKSALFPDILYPLHIEQGKIPEKQILSHHQYCVLWIELNIPQDIKPDTYTFTIKISSDETKMQNTAIFDLHVLEEILLKSQFKFTQWFHLDCLADYYDNEVFSEKHWQRIEEFMHCAVDNGITMLLTPIFTPPLDIYSGGERKTVQLVDIVKEKNAYHFSFDPLHRFINLAKKCGILYFEIAHLFTQWGAKYPPKIVANVDGQRINIFGGKPDAAKPLSLALSSEYADFLNCFLPQLVSELKKAGIENKTYFHISDEPNAKNDLENYKAAKNLIKSHLNDFPIIDAVSDYIFAEQKIIETPVVAIDAIDTFIKHKVKPLWGYYCCAQCQKVSNRFFAIPSWRNRIIGLLLYKFDLDGFLHWGFNFYYSQYSRCLIDPFNVPDALGAFPAGDPFSVYPGKDGPLPSIRLKVFYEALQDRQFLKQIEAKIGKNETLEILEKTLSQPLDFKNYPKGVLYLYRLREYFFKRGILK